MQGSTIYKAFGDSRPSYNAHKHASDKHSNYTQTCRPGETDPEALEWKRLVASPEFYRILTCRDEEQVDEEASWIGPENSELGKQTKASTLVVLSCLTVYSQIVLDSCTYQYVNPIPSVEVGRNASPQQVIRVLRHQTRLMHLFVPLFGHLFWKSLL